MLHLNLLIVWNTHIGSKLPSCWTEKSEFFRENTNGFEAGESETLAEKIFNCKVNIARELQVSDYQKKEEYAQYRMDLVDELNQQVIELNSDSFRVKMQMRYVENFRQRKAWENLETKEVTDLKKYVAPLIMPKKENELARRFDYLIYSIELAQLQSRNADRNKNIVSVTAERLSNLYSIPQIKEQQYVIEKVKAQSFWKDTSIFEMDAVRDALRDLIKFLEKDTYTIYYTNFQDTIVEEQEGEAIYASNDLKNYRKKVEFYLKEHQDNLSVYKLRSNKKLSSSEMQELERILWKELGTREDYEKEYGDTPVGRLVRRIVGVDREVVNAAFSEFLSEEGLNLNQIRFVRLMIDYIVANGNIENNAVLMEEPFRSVGSITTLFKDDMVTAKKIMDVAADIKKNSEEIA